MIAKKGGSLYLLPISTQKMATILIEESEFKKSYTNCIATSAGHGGVIYLDSTGSLIKLEVKKTKF